MRCTGDLLFLLITLFFNNHICRREAEPDIFKISIIHLFFNSIRRGAVKGISAGADGCGRIRLQRQIFKITYQFKNTVWRQNRKGAGNRLDRFVRCVFDFNIEQNIAFVIPVKYRFVLDGYLKDLRKRRNGNVFRITAKRTVFYLYTINSVIRLFVNFLFINM